MELGKTLLLTHHSRLGDPVLSIPLHKALAPVSDLHSNVGDSYRSIFSLARISPNWTQELHPKSLIEILQSAKALRAQKFETVFLIRPSFRAALLARLAHIPTRVGEASEGRGFLLTHKLPYSATRNELNHISQLAKIVGVEVKREWSFQPSASSQKQAATMIQDAVVGIVPGVSWPGKAVPTETWQSVIQALEQNHIPCVLLGGPGDNRYADPLANGKVVHASEQLDLAGLISAFQKLKVVVASDGGLYHLSVASGTPTIGIFGPTSAKRWGHEWDQHVTIQAPGNSLTDLSYETIVDRILERAVDN